jgi:hypothetical protein
VALKRPSCAGAEYPLPAPQRVLSHAAAPAAAYVPGAHAAWVALVDPAGHAYPALQLPLHAALVKPRAAPKVPPGHGVAEAAAPVGQYEPAGQASTHVSLAVALPPAHVYPLSTAHEALHPSPATSPPSSQNSVPVRRPSPHFWHTSAADALPPAQV